MLACLLLGYLFGVGSVVAAASIRRARFSAQQRDQECLDRFGESHGGRHD